MEFDEGIFEDLKNKSEEIYKNIEKVRCPYLANFVYFNSKGLEHLKFKGRNKARSGEDQNLRLKLLYIAPEVLCNSKTVQGISEQKVFESIRSNGRTDHLLVNAKFHEFIAIIKNH